MSSSLAEGFDATANQNKEGVSKHILKELIRATNMQPGINMALFISSGALALKKTWTGSDYGEHWLRVAALGLGDLVSDEEKIVGILHDVVEDSDWEIEDLEEVGFGLKICSGVRSVTKLPGEKYLDSSMRASIDPIGRRVKPRDNKDNMDLTRSAFAATNKQKYLYHISYTYLRAVELDEIPPNYSMWSFLQIPKYAGLINQDNIGIVAKEISEPMPAAIAAKFRAASPTLKKAPA